MKRKNKIVHDLYLIHNLQITKSNKTELRLVIYLYDIRPGKDLFYTGLCGCISDHLISILKSNNICLEGAQSAHTLEAC